MLYTEIVPGDQIKVTMGSNPCPPMVVGVGLGKMFYFCYAEAGIFCYLINSKFAFF